MVWGASGDLGAKSLRWWKTDSDVISHFPKTIIENILDF